MFKIYFGRFFLFLLLTLLSFEAVAEQKLRVGLALPLSGVGAPYGEAYKNGLMLGLTENSNLIELKVEDHQYDNKLALAAVRKLVQIDGVDLVIVWGYAPSDAVAPIVPSLKLPVLLGSINPVAKQQHKIFNLSSPLKNVLDPLIDYLNEKNYKDVAILASQIGSLEQSARKLQSLLPKSKVKKFEVVLPDQMDFRSLIVRLKSSKIGTAGLFLTPPQIKVFIEQARTLEFNISLFGIDTFNDSSISKLFDKQEKGPIFVDVFSDNNFLQMYSERYNSTSHIVEAARGKLLASLLNHVSTHASPAFDQDSIIDAIHSFPDGTGPAGKYKVINDKDFGSYLSINQVLYQMTSGKIEKIQDRG